jgi:hypothetical protein
MAIGWRMRIFGRGVLAVAVRGVLEVLAACHDGAGAAPDRRRGTGSEAAQQAEHSALRSSTVKVFWTLLFMANVLLVG